MTSSSRNMCNAFGIALLIGKYACPNSGSGGPELPEAGKFCDREQLEGPTDVLQGTC
jgi:hypothetical protein